MGASSVGAFWTAVLYHYGGHKAVSYLIFLDRQEPNGRGMEGVSAIYPLKTLGFLEDCQDCPLIVS